MVNKEILNTLYLHKDSDSPFSDLNSLLNGIEKGPIKQLEHMLSQNKNPYCIISGDTKVIIEYSNCEKSLENSLKSFFIREK